MSTPVIGITKPKNSKKIMPARRECGLFNCWAKQHLPIIIILMIGIIISPTIIPGLIRHRIYFDKTYVWPEANGVHLVNGGWDTSINKEYIFERCRVWLDKYFGPDHGITFGVTETGINSEDANVVAVWYASTLGEFTKQGVELFTPWSWKPGMWEVLHMFARYHQPINVSSTSSDETKVSAYSAISNDGRNLSTILVNRSVTDDQLVSVSLNNYQIKDGDYQVLMLSQLPNDETFKSHVDNALKSSFVHVSNGRFEITLPRLSVSGIWFNGITAGVAEQPAIPCKFGLTVYPHPFNSQTTLRYTIPEDNQVELLVFDVQGRQIESFIEKHLLAGEHIKILDTSMWSSGIYLVQLKTGTYQCHRKILFVK